jgi:hypothetical protein
MVTTLDRTFHHPISLTCSDHRSMSRWPTYAAGLGELLRSCWACDATWRNLQDPNGDCWARSHLDWPLDEVIAGTAHHEAAHTVAVLLAGQRVDEVVVRRDPDVDVSTDPSGWVRWNSTRTKVDVMDHLVVCWAGQMAGLRYLEEIGRDTPTDRFDIIHGSSDDAGQAYKLAADHGLPEDAGMRAARLIVRSEWATIARLARELCTRGRLDDTEVRAIVGL